MSASSKKKLRKEQNAAALTEKQQKAKAEAKKLKIATIIFVVVMIAVLITAATVMIVKGINNSGMIEKNTVALTVGDHKLNSVEMNYYFTDSVNNTYSEWTTNYGEYASLYLSMMGLDTALPLDQQPYYDGEGTWADYFMDMAIDRAKANYATYDYAIANGYSLSKEDESSIENNLSTFQMYAMINGVDLDTFLKLYYGTGASEKSFREYMEVVTIASRCYNEYEESLTYDDAAISAYDQEHSSQFNSYNYNSYYLSASDFLDLEEGVEATAEQTAAALEQAKAAAESLTVAKNVEELDAAIAALEINADASSAESNAYTDTLYTSIVTSVREWITDPARKANDIAVLPYEVVEEHEHTEEAHEHHSEIQGYYVVMFQSVVDNSELMSNVRHLLVQFEEDEEGNVTDEAKAAAKAEAEGYLKQWQEGEATEDSFIELVQKHSADSSADNGGLFEDIHKDSSYVTNFLNWSIDDSRKAGDTGVVETEYGYHVMYYVGDDELTYREHMIIEAMTEADLEAWYNDVTDVTVTEGDLSKIATDVVLDGETA